MNNYEYNPEHGELKVYEDALGGRHWEIHLNSRGMAFITESISSPTDKIHITGQIEGEAYLSFGKLIGTGALIKNA